MRNEINIRRIARLECTKMLEQLGLVEKEALTMEDIHPGNQDNTTAIIQTVVEKQTVSENPTEAIPQSNSHTALQNEEPRDTVDSNLDKENKQATRTLYSNRLATTLTHEFESYAEVLQKNIANRKVTFCDDNREINLNANILKGELEFPVTLLLDTGAQRSFISQRFFDNKLANHIQKRQSYIRMYGVGGNELATTGEVLLDVQLGDEIIRQKFIIADIKEQGILGFDFCQNHQAEWRWKDKEITLKGGDRHWVVSALYGCIQNGLVHLTIMRSDSGLVSRDPSIFCLLGVERI